ncbi:hypothetical protein HAX54_041155, partial [Datura stramonium]|nr:hypothetical protein [Datura stramonium]
GQVVGSPTLITSCGPENSWIEPMDAQYRNSFNDRSNGSSFHTTACTEGTMTSKGNKKQQEAATWKEIAKKRQLQDEPDSDSSSGSKVNYNIETSEGNEDNEAEEFGDDHDATKESGEKGNSVEDLMIRKVQLLSPARKRTLTLPPNQMGGTINGPY